MDKISYFYKNLFSMSSISFYPNKATGQSKVYLRCFIKKGQDFRLSTGLTIVDSSKWKNGFPKSNAGAEYKKLDTRLRELKHFLEERIRQIELSQSESIHDITSRWIKNLILEFNNEVPTLEKNIFLNYIEDYIENKKNSYYIQKGIRKKYSESTIEKYDFFKKNIEEYQNYLGKKLKINNISLQFVEQFAEYLSKKKQFSINHIGREIKRLKTIIRDADYNGYSVDRTYLKIKGFEDETIVNFLTFEELETIKSNKMPTERLERARDWLIIGCYTGQRVSDLFRMTKTSINKRKGFRFIVIRQYKTNKLVNIPIHPYVEEILQKYNNDFPPNYSTNEKSNRSILSQLFKEVCKISKIDYIERGRYNGKIGDYPKYQLISNHSTRKSFCSNLYGKKDWNNQIIMAVSGHVSEKSFLLYIDKEDDSLSIQAAKNFQSMYAETIKSKEEVKLKKA